MNDGTQLYICYTNSYICYNNLERYDRCKSCIPSRWSNSGKIYSMVKDQQIIDINDGGNKKDIAKNVH